MARGRFITKTMFDSKRLENLPERTVLVFVMIVVNANAIGRFEADVDTLLSWAGRYGRLHRWDEDTMTADRDALARKRLIRLWRTDGDLYGLVSKWEDHNRPRVDRERANTIPDPPWERGDNLGTQEEPPEQVVEGGEVPPAVISGVLPEDSRRTPGGLPPKVKVKDKTKAKLKWKANPAGDDTEPHVRIHERADRLLRCWPEMFRQVNERSEMPMAAPPLSFEDATKLAREVAALDFLEDDDLLIDEMRRVCVCFDEKELARFKAATVIRQLGQVFEGTSEPNPVYWQKQETDGPVTDARVRKLIDDIGREV